jgi:hypothetical protein
MRTTIRLEDPLLRQAKARASERGISLNDFISDAVRAALQPRAANRRSVLLPTFAGGSLLPGVDLDDSAALLHLMEHDLTYAAHTSKQRATARKIAEAPVVGAVRKKPSTRR